jgi:PEP-CTERM motif
VNGDYDQLAGSTLEIEITDLANFDAVDVTGTADLAGLVSVMLDPSFTLAAGNSFQILTAANLIDSGIALALGGDNDQFTLDVNTSTGIVSLLSNLAGLLGDYNGDDTIDAADYTAWRDAMTAGATSLPNDPTPGTVDESDFLYWRAHFGESLGSGSGQGSAGTVPEPGSLMLMLAAVFALVSWQRRS